MKKRLHTVTAVLACLLMSTATPALAESPKAEIGPHMSAQDKEKGFYGNIIIGGVYGSSDSNIDPSDDRERIDSINKSGDSESEAGLLFGGLHDPALRDQGRESDRYRCPTRD